METGALYDSNIDPVVKRYQENPHHDVQITPFSSQQGQGASGIDSVTTSDDQHIGKDKETQITDNANYPKNAGTLPKNLGSASTLMVSDGTHVSFLIAIKLFQQVAIYRGTIGFIREKNLTTVPILAVMHIFPVTTIAYNTTGLTFSQLRARKVTERARNCLMSA